MAAAPHRPQHPPRRPWRRWAAGALALVVLLAALWLRLDLLPLLMVMLPVGFTWVVECLNTAIEAAVDLAMPEVHPLAKLAKDVGSAATFLSASLSVIVALLLLGPPLYEKLAG